MIGGCIVGKWNRHEMEEVDGRYHGDIARPETHCRIWHIAQYIFFSLLSVNSPISLITLHQPDLQHTSLCMLSGSEHVHMSTQKYGDYPPLKYPSERWLRDFTLISRIFTKTIKERTCTKIKNRIIESHRFISVLWLISHSPFALSFLMTIAMKTNHPSAMRFTHFRKEPPGILSGFFVFYTVK